MRTTTGHLLSSYARRGDLVKLNEMKEYVDFEGAVDSDGRNILMSACFWRQAEVVRWYLATSRTHAQLYAVDDTHCSCAHFAASGGERNGDVETDTPECLELICQAGADMNAMDICGSTPLHNATFQRQTNILSYLLSHTDANPTTKNYSGCTPRDVALHMLEDPDVGTDVTRRGIITHMADILLLREQECEPRVPTTPLPLEDGQVNVACA